jgi:hypothetical protein
MPNSSNPLNPFTVPKDMAEKAMAIYRAGGDVWAWYDAAMRPFRPSGLPQKRLVTAREFDCMMKVGPVPTCESLAAELQLYKAPTTAED